MGNRYFIFISLFFFLSLISCASKKKSLVSEEKFKIDHQIVSQFETKELKAKPPKKKTPLKVKRNLKGEKKTSYLEDYPEKLKQYDEKSRILWKKFKPGSWIHEKHVFVIHYFGLKVGHLQILGHPLVNIGKQRAYHFQAKIKSAQYYSYIYRLDDSLNSYISVENFLPLKYVLTQRESRQKVDDLQLFDHEKLKTHFWYKREKKGKLKREEKSQFIPHYFQDVFSALYFLRGLPFEVGNRYEFLIVSRGRVWELKVRVEKKERIHISGKEEEAFRLKISRGEKPLIGKPKARELTKGPAQQKKGILFWYSADSMRKLLKFEAKIKIGFLKGELVEFKKGSSL